MPAVSLFISIRRLNVAAVAHPPRHLLRLEPSRSHFMTVHSAWKERKRKAISLQLLKDLRHWLIPHATITVEPLISEQIVRLFATIP
jgi:predicted RNA polymerase sigma factor